MKGLLIKDFKLMKGQKNYFLVIVAISIVLAVTSDDTSFSIGFLGFVGSMFTLSSISYDEFDNGNAFLFSLPITRKSYVLEKYSFGLLVGGGAWLFGTLISMAAAFARNSGSVTEILATASGVLATLIITISVMLPFQLKFGGEKGRIAIIGAVGILVILGVAFVKAAEFLGIDLIGYLNSLSAIGMGTFLVIMIGTVAAIMLVSIKISISVMSKKEF